MSSINKFARSAGGFFNKGVHAGERLFNKGAIGGSKLFGKGSIGSKALHSVSSGLGDFSKLAKQGSKGLDKILDNDKVQMVLGSNPFGQSIASAGRALQGGLGGLSSASSFGADLAKQKNYSGDVSKVAGNILERAKDTGDAVKKIEFV